MSKLSHLLEIDHVLTGRDMERDVVVEQSGRRCVAEYGRDPAKPNPAHIVTEARFKEHRKQSERQVSIARSGRETLFRQIAGQTYVLLLPDAKGVTVDCFGDPTFAEELRQAGLFLGSDWSEELAGTCATPARRACRCVTSGPACCARNTFGGNFLQNAVLARFVMTFRQ